MIFGPDEITKQIEDMVKVKRQRVILAKKFFQERFNNRTCCVEGECYQTKTMIEALLNSENVKMPTEVIIQIEGGIMNDATRIMMQTAAESISWTIAGCEAIWGLFTANLLFPSEESPRLVCLVENPGYSQSGQSGRLSFKRSSFRIWEEVQFSRSNIMDDQVLSDPDLFLQTLNIQSLHRDVEEALRESVRCFRHELYLASLTMLGRATEGAWIEAGMRLASHNSSGAELEKFLLNQFKGIGEKIGRIRKFFNNTDQAFRTTLGVSTQDLETVAAWSDLVRDSRNSIHYGAVPSMPNTYEKIATLLLGAVTHFRLLYKI